MDLLQATTAMSGKNEYDQLIADLEAGDVSLSYSSIKQFMKSPRHFISYKLKEFEPTDAMNEGTLCDMLLTEPDKVESTFGVIPTTCNKSSKSGVAAFEEFLQISVPDWKSRGAVIDAALSATGKIFVDKSVWDKCVRIADKVKTNYASAWILENSEQNQAEVSFEDFGWTWRGRMDLYCPGFFTADLKKTSDADPQFFHRQIRKLKYDLQGAIYNHGKDQPYFIIGYDNQAAVSVTQLKPSAMQSAWGHLARTMDKFNECVALNQWNRSYDFWPSNHQGIYTY